MNTDAIRQKSDLTEKQLAVLNSEMEKYKKSTGLSYVFWFFLGTLGIHKFYLGKIAWGIIYLLLGIGAWSSLIVGLVADTGTGVGLATGMIVFIVFIGILGLLLLIDVFTIPRQIRKAYEKKERKIISAIVVE